MRTLALTLFVAVLIASQSGCNFSRGRLARALPTTGHYDDGTDDSSDPWIAAAADEGRVEFRKEKESDPLGLKKYWMSQKARDIERNMGIE
jgi:hypothetical protein